MIPTVIRAHSPEQWAEVAAEFCASFISETVNRTGRCSVLLSGGETPKALFERLGQEPFASNIPWPQVLIAWGDERLVAPDDERSNQRMAFRALLDNVAVRPEYILTVDTSYVDAATAAHAYEQKIREALQLGPTELPRFDLALMGLGTDGHTASLFPGMPTLQEHTRLAVGTPAPDPAGPARVSLTLPVFNAARAVVFLVTGAAKAPLVRRVLQPTDPADAATLPAAHVQPAAPDAQLVWIVDEAAAQELEA